MAAELEAIDDYGGTLDPPARPTFEVKAEREGPTSGPKESSIDWTDFPVSLADR
jgi:hypothetical protein